MKINPNILWAAAGAVVGALLYRQAMGTLYEITATACYDALDEFSETAEITEEMSPPLHGGGGTLTSASFAEKMRKMDEYDQ